MDRVAIIFDNRLRPETTGTYCRRTLGQMVQEGRLAEVEHFLPVELDRIDPKRFDLFLYVDDGLNGNLRDDLRPAAWWAIDTHVTFERCLAKGREADVTFAAQHNGAERLSSCGIKNIQWLPLACDPDIHARQPVENQFDVAFVGHVAPGPREDLLRLIQGNFPRSFFGQVPFTSMAGVYSASRTVFNRSIVDDVNMRVFEGLCSGSLLLTNDLAENGQSDLFQEGLHCDTYRDAEELLDKLRYYLKHDEVRERIASDGRREVLAKHTYRHRMETIVAALLYQRSQRPTQVSVRVPSPPTVKDHTYFEFDRPDVLELVPQAAKNVLDVGCGTGRLGDAIKQRQSARVTGIELNAAPARQARQRLDEVLVGDACDPRIEFPPGSFDCVICADVLEHLRDPAALLRRIRRWLQPGGTLVASIPNVRHHSVIRSLMEGNWTYETAGLLDEDHVRFFTRREIEKLLYRTGFDVAQLRIVTGPGDEQWRQSGSPRQVRIGPFQLHAASDADAEEFFAYQYLVTSRPAPEQEFGITSIVLVTHNQWHHTKACLDSIRLRTDEPCELIVVDNGSTDGTVEFLRSCPDVQLIENTENRGFPAAVNQGLRTATGAQVLLLNNDTLVTTGWLRRMLDALQDGPSVGLVGPVSNNVSGEQQVPVSYDDLAQLDGFAWDWGRSQRGCIVNTDRLVGFCLLIRRDLIEAVGGLDERFGIGNFEDDDYCRRAREAGFDCRIALDAFVHHVGSATFQGSGVDQQRLLVENKRRYEEKWGDTRGTNEPIQTNVSAPDDHAPASRKPRFLFDINDQGEFLLKENHVRLSACLIVRDNERTIRPCLESLAPWVDEIIVVDTGSTDRTPDICAELGARVFHWAWRDDFAAARNESLRHANGDWIFWMDSDDTLPEECGRQLRKLALGPHAENILGYVIQVHCPGQDPTDVTVVDHVKLIRNRYDLQFEFRIHEQILPAIRRAGGDVAWTDLYVVHSGSERGPVGQAHKLERDFFLLQLEFAERGDHPFVFFNLGMTHADANELPEAAEFLQRCINVSGPDESHLRKAYALLAATWQRLGRHEDAESYCSEGLLRFPDDKELLFRRALLHQDLGHWEQAERDYLRILQPSGERHFMSRDAGIGSFKARHNLAIVYQQLDRTSEEREQWQRLIEESPSYEPGWQGWAMCLVRQCDWDAMDRFLTENASDPPCGRAFLHIMQGMRAAHVGDGSHARKCFEQAIGESPRNVFALNQFCRFLFERGEMASAAGVLGRLIELDSEDPAAFHNLGVALQSCGQLEQARAAFGRSLELRPTAVGTLQAVEECLWSLGEVAEAGRLGQQRRRLVPGSQPLEILATAGAMP